MDEFRASNEHEPLVLIIPGIHGSGPQHWQSLWERERDDCARVDLGMWDKPQRNVWVNKLNHAIHAASRPVILVAHSLGCHAVAWWAALERPESDSVVRGALLVAPPDLDGIAPENALSTFAPTAQVSLPFDTILVASQNDPYIGLAQAKALATRWGAQFADAGRVGHINAESDLGNWGFGQFLLAQLAARTGPAPHARTQRISHAVAAVQQDAALRP